MSFNLNYSPMSKTFYAIYKKEKIKSKVEYPPEILKKCLNFFGNIGEYDQKFFILFYLD